MAKRRVSSVVKIVLASLAYGGLTLAVTLYIISGDTISRGYSGGGLEQAAPTVITGFMASIISLIANIVIIAKYRGGLRIASIFGVLLSLVAAALLFIPLAFIIG